MATRLSLLLFLLSTLTGGLCQLVFRDSPATATVLVGYPTTLRCSARDPTPPDNILWFKDGVAVTPDSRFTITYESSAGDSELEISTVRYPDAGGYQCIAVGSSNQILAASSVGTLTVNGHPEFGRPLSSITVAVGGRVEFNCDVLSVPSSTVSWSYESGGVQQNLTTGGRITISPSTTLTITNVQASDDGYYICTAENSFGRNTTSGRLTVGTPPPPLTLSLTPSSSITVVQGDNAVITCSAPDSIHLTSIQWMRGSNVTTAGVARTANSLALTLSNVQLQDGGNYVCTAMDSLGDMETITAVVVVDVPPRITAPPSNLTILENIFLNPPPTCQATGEPLPTYSWFRPNGSPIPIIGGAPQFGILTRGDSGTYSCVATNRAGQVRAEFNILVEGPPLFTVTPTDTTTSSGQDITFRCEAVGPPAPSYTWTRVGRTLPSGAVNTGNTLNLFSVSTDDAGVYQCTAGSSRGTVNAQATLTVLSPPSITQATTTPLYLNVGSPFTLDCVWTGSPSTVQSWYLNGTLLSPSSDPRLQTWPNGSLMVSNPSESYTGIYLCNVSNAFEFVTSQVSVTVGEPPRITISPSSMDLAPGTTAFLSCVPNGFPQPWTTWFKTDIFGSRSQLPNFGITFTKFSNGLQLHDVGREDSGMYECVAENRLGSMRQDAMVRVEGAPVASEVESVTLDEGATNANLSCLTRFNFPMGTVFWSREDGQPLPASRFSVGPTGQLTIVNVLREDSGTFMCVIQNQYGQSSASGTISVNYAPSISIPNSMVTATLRQSFTLSCPTEGQPSPTVQWTPPTGLSQNSYRVEASGDLTVFSANAQSVGVYTCEASNSVGSASGQVEIIVRGLSVQSLGVTVLSSSTVFVLWTPRPGNTPQSYELEIRVVGAPNIPVMEFTSGGTSRSRTVQNLAGGTQYNFTIRPIYEDGIAGTDVSTAETTRETAPSGPPQNVMLLPLELSLYITWEEPAFADRGGTILTFDIFYRPAPSDPELGGPFTAILDLPNSASGQVSDNSSSTVQVYILRELIAEIPYEVKIRAVTVVGPGPNSTEVIGTPMPPRSFQPLNFQLTQNAVIGIGAVLGGVCIIIIVALAIGLLVYIIWEHRVTTGKHETLAEEEDFERRQRKREKRRKVISDPIPGMVDDRETKKKLSLKSKDGKILAKPKVIKREDMAAKPKPGKKVKRVPRDEILISQNDDEDYDSQYDDPADVIESSFHEDYGKQRQPESPRIKLKGEQETNLYSEPVRRTKKKRPPSDDESEDEGSMDKEEEVPPYDDVYEDVEMGGGSGDDDDDEPSQVYATVSAQHKTKKRVKMLERQQQEDLKEEKKRRKMEEKMERERLKKEAKDRKAAEKKHKEAEKNKSKMSKEDKRRQSLGLGNIVRLQDVDFGSGDARAQAEFIDSATAALF